MVDRIQEEPLILIEGASDSNDPTVATANSLAQQVLNRAPLSKDFIAGALSIAGNVGMALESGDTDRLKSSGLIRVLEGHAISLRNGITLDDVVVGGEIDPKSFLYGVYATIRSLVLAHEDFRTDREQRQRAYEERASIRQMLIEHLKGAETALKRRSLELNINGLLGDRIDDFIQTSPISNAINDLVAEGTIFKDRTGYRLSVGAASGNTPQEIPNI